MKRVKIGIFIFLSIFLVSCIDTEIILSGKVVNKSNGMPIANAKVSDGDYGKGNMGLTDDSGQFSYTTYCEEHKIEISAEGYKTMIKTIKTPLIVDKKEITIDIKMEKE